SSAQHGGLIEAGGPRALERRRSRRRSRRPGPPGGGPDGAAGGALSRRGSLLEQNSHRSKRPSPLDAALQARNAPPFTRRPSPGYPRVFLIPKLVDGLRWCVKKARGIPCLLESGDSIIRERALASW